MTYTSLRSVGTTCYCGLHRFQNSGTNVVFLGRIMVSFYSINVWKSLQIIQFAKCGWVKDVCSQSRDLQEQSVGNVQLDLSFFFYVAPRFSSKPHLCIKVSTLMDMR